MDKMFIPFWAKKTV